MKHILICLLITFSFTACHTTKNATSSGADGSSFDKAIVVHEKTETKGVAWEYKWLAANYPGYSLDQQSLVYSNNKPYDKMDIKTASGESKTIYFDISNFFGKW